MISLIGRAAGVLILSPLAVSVARAESEPCPLLWWHLDEGAGAVARDSHLRGVDGEPSGDFTGDLHDADELVWYPEGGRIGGALEFPGDYGFVTANSFLTSGPEFTLSFWMRAAVWTGRWWCGSGAGTNSRKCASLRPTRRGVGCR